MPKKIDLTNQRFQNLVVLREATKKEKNNKPGAWWVCQCDCGNIVIKDGQGLRKGYTTSCGCKTQQKLKNRHKAFIDETGNRYGKLVVLERDYQKEKENPKRGSTYWKCQCDCGNIVTVLRSSLINGKTQSCGCIKKQLMAKKLSQISKENFIDETGNRYGKLVVLKKIENLSTRNGTKWLCQCDCGNYKEVMGIDLRKGIVTSCGCLGKSKGEYYIQKILKQQNIPYQKEYIVTIKNKQLRYDFLIKKEEKIFYFIEFDGKQHFQPIQYFGGDEYFNYIKQHDILKNQWCKQNNIPLIRIPYTHLKDLCIKDLLLETSNFII